MAMIVKYSSDGMKQIIQEQATAKDFGKLFREKKKEAKGDVEKQVDWLSNGQFEVSCDRWAAAHTYRLRPDNWPVNNGEPQ